MLTVQLRLVVTGDRPDASPSPGNRIGVTSGQPAETIILGANFTVGNTM